MHSWSRPSLPEISPALLSDQQLSLYDSASQTVREVKAFNDDAAGAVAGMYVCGITPYDATHLGHAATYVTFDLVYRMLLAQGVRVEYVQNVTDVDDPLFERAERDGVDWRDLGSSQIQVFRDVMEQLSVLPPAAFVGAMESVDEVIDMVQTLLDKGAAYQVEGEYPDVYAKVGATKQFGYESHYDRETMEALFAERGGDPDRQGKQDPLDALLWRAARPGEPSWEAPFGAGRPGWHVECSAIAMNRIGSVFSIQGGGSDLMFPHHEFSAAHAEACYGIDRMAGHYVHAGMIGLDGQKMSKSLGNLVFASKLIEQGVDPSAIRLGLYASHYRDDRQWSTEVLDAAIERLQRWREAFKLPGSVQRDRAMVRGVHATLANDLDTPRVLFLIDQWADARLEQSAYAGDTADAAALSESSEQVAHAIEALLGVRLVP